jgi:hypothetical protein
VFLSYLLLCALCCDGAGVSAGVGAGVLSCLVFPCLADALPCLALLDRDNTVRRNKSEKKVKEGHTWGKSLGI